MTWMLIILAMLAYHNSIERYLGSCRIQIHTYFLGFRFEYISKGTWWRRLGALYDLNEL